VYRVALARISVRWSRGATQGGQRDIPILAEVS
jgi:hypothetical protein